MFRGLRLCNTHINKTPHTHTHEYFKNPFLFQFHPGLVTIQSQDTKNIPTPIHTSRQFRVFHWYVLGMREDVRIPQKNAREHREELASSTLEGLSQNVLTRQSRPNSNFSHGTVDAMFFLIWFSCRTKQTNKKQVLVIRGWQCIFCIVD